MNAKFSLLVAGFAGSLAIAAVAIAQQQADTGKIATVNGKDIPKARADVLARQRIAQGQPDTPQMRTAVRDELINRELLAAEAERRGVAKTPDIQQQLELTRQQILITGLLAEWGKTSTVSDAELKTEYDKMRTQLGTTEFKARHILVETEAEAKDLLAKLKGGAKFDELAKGSKDPGSKDNGGDLGWSTPATFVKPFATALTTLKKGETTPAPIQTQFGYHVIRLDDTRPIAHPPMEQVKQQLQQRVQQQQFEKLVADLRAKAKIQ